MAHQDYVSRSRTPNKKSNPYKKNQNQAPQGASMKVKLIGLFTLVAISVFGYFLWVIKDSQQDVAPVPVEKTATKTATNTTEKDLPEPPKEKWAYMEELKTKEVEEGQYEVTDRGPWQMQCGSFRTKKQAEVLKANIAFTGIASTIRQVSGKNGTWYKVLLGPYEKKRSAERDKHKLKTNNVNYCQIWLWR